MNFELTDEQKMMRDSVARFGDKRLADLGESLEREQWSSIRRELGGLGLWSLTASVDAGGAGFSLPAACLAIAELAHRHRHTAQAVALHLGLVIPALAGVDDVNSDWLDGSTALGLIFQAPSSPQSWLALCPGQIPEKFLVVTDGEPRKLSVADASNLALRPLPGLAAPPATLQTLAPDALDISSLTVISDNIPPSWPGPDGPLALASVALGIATAALDEARAYAAERTQFGRPINKFQAIRFKLADMATAQETSRWTILRAAADDSQNLAQLALRHATESAQFIADESLQIHGGYGYTEEYPVESLYRASRQLLMLARQWPSPLSEA